MSFDLIMDYQSLLNRLLTSEFHSECMDLRNESLAAYALQGFYGCMEDPCPIQDVFLDDNDRPFFTEDEADALFAYLRNT